MAVAIPPIGILPWFGFWLGLSNSAVPVLGLCLDILGVLLISYTVIPRTEFDRGEHPIIRPFGWTTRVEWIEKYSRLDVLAARVGLGLIIAGFMLQAVGTAT